MSELSTSRRRFIQGTAGLTLALRHGLISAQTGDSATKSAAVAVLGDSAAVIEFDAHMYTRVSHRVGAQWLPLTSWGPSEYLMVALSVPPHTPGTPAEEMPAEGRHIARFALQAQAHEAVDGLHGPGARLTVRGMAREGVEKTIEIELFRRYPGFMFSRVSYRNLSPNSLEVGAWTTGDFQLVDSPTGGSGFWCYSGGSYADRRDWVQPVKARFAQDNFMGMSATDYGGGMPIVDVWRKDGGLAVGHLESAPKLVSLPVQERQGRVRLAVCSRVKSRLATGEHLQTLQTFVAVHKGDYFASLASYRRIMGDRGLKSPDCGPGCYEPIWCAWGYERACTVELIEGTLPKVQELGLQWAVIDDGWQSTIGDWNLNPSKYPRGAADMNALVTQIKSAGLKPRLWYSPLSVAPGADLLHDHADMLLLDKDGAAQNITWWNSFYLCPAYDETIAYTQTLIRRFLGEWGFQGLKIDGQHLNGVAPCFNPAHAHSRPEDSVEGLQNFYRAIYQTAIEINPQAVIEVCPCGTAYSVFNFPFMNQAPASDPESSWQVRLKGKTLKALMGPNAPFAGDHVELSDHGDDFASTIGVGGIVSTKFTWPRDPKPKDSFLLTPKKEREWRRWIALYKEKMLSLGTYRGELYDIGFDKPETHAIEKAGRMYYSLFAPTWADAVTLRGLGSGTFRVHDYLNNRDLGIVSAAHNRLNVSFDHHLLLEATPV